MHTMNIMNTTNSLNPIWNEDARSLVWSKVLINIAINPIAAITGQKNGELLDGEIFETCTEVMLEGARVARLEGVVLADDDKLIDNLKSVLQNTKENKCSMLQDVRLGKNTEIMFLNRMIVDRAEKYGLSTPLNQLLSKLIEDIYLVPNGMFPHHRLKYHLALMMLHVLLWYE